jgi:polyvinyl alcohol dehydrogenase (cytochrome)
MRLLQVLIVAGVMAVPAHAWAQQGAATGEALYARLCANCHDNGIGRAQNRAAFRDMPAERVLASMETGSMVTMANNRTAAERRAVAEFLTGKSLSVALVTTPSPQAMCGASSSSFDANGGARWSGWGHTANSRFQENPGLTAADVPRLRLKWAFAFPGDLQSYSQATLAGGRLFTGSWGGKVYALDASRGCIHWYFDAGEGVRSAVTVGPVSAAPGARQAAFFGDASANVYALDGWCSLARTIRASPA